MCTTGGRHARSQVRGYRAWAQWDSLGMPGGVMPGGVWRVACGVWRVACGVWRAAAGGRQWAVVSLPQLSPRFVPRHVADLRWPGLPRLLDGVLSHPLLHRSCCQVAPTHHRCPQHPQHPSSRHRPTCSLEALEAQGAPPRPGAQPSRQTDRQRNRERNAQPEPRTTTEIVWRDRPRLAALRPYLDASPASSGAGEARSAPFRPNVWWAVFPT